MPHTAAQQRVEHALPDSTPAAPVAAHCQHDLVRVEHDPTTEATTIKHTSSLSTHTHILWQRVLSHPTWWHGSLSPSCFSAQTSRITNFQKKNIKHHMVHSLPRPLCPTYDLLESIFLVAWNNVRHANTPTHTRKENSSISTETSFFFSFLLSQKLDPIQLLFYTLQLLYCT